MVQPQLVAEPAQAALKLRLVLQRRLLACALTVQLQAELLQLLQLLQVLMQQVLHCPAAVPRLRPLPQHHP